MSVRVLSLVLSVDREPWRTIERDGQRATWAAPSDLDDTAPVRFYRSRLTGPVRFSVAAVTRILDLAGAGRAGSAASAARDRFFRSLGRHYCHASASTVDDVLHLRMPETYAMVATKLYAALAHVLATEDFDYLLRTNTSTYVDRQRLLHHAEAMPRSGYWGGFIGTHEGARFTSGAGTLLSRDVVAAALTGDWDWSLIDDVALGRVLHSLGFDPRPIDRPVLTSPDQVATTDLDAFMWRCKGVEERNDVAIMRALHDALRAGH